MTDKLLNIKEVCSYLKISEKDLRALVDRGEIPAYRLGGTILRFRKDQIEPIKRSGIPKLIKPEEIDALSSAKDSQLERLKDFFYFNDFYIFAAIVILTLLVIIFFT
jgi:excisionase family DNA binding protein